MPDERRFCHISSAIVAMKPGHGPAVMEAIAAMEGTEIHAHDDVRVVVVIEGGSTGEMGQRLTLIGDLDGVIAANLVFEHIEELEASEP